VESCLFHVKHSRLAITLTWTYAARCENPCGEMFHREQFTNSNLCARCLMVQLHTFHVEQDTLRTAAGTFHVEHSHKKYRSTWNAARRSSAV
jgi:hypothetical protein